MRKAHHVVSHLALASVLILAGSALWSFAEEHPTGTSGTTQTQTASAVQPAVAPTAQPEAASSEQSAETSAASATAQPAEATAEHPTGTSAASATAQPASGEHPVGASTATAQPAGEHPAGAPAAAQKEGEHPKKAQEHPGKKGFFQRIKGWFGHEHPTGEAAVRESYTKTVEAHVAEASKKDGALKIHDDVLNKDWMLKLDKVHKKNIARLGENQFFACADFVEVNGKGKLDLDFYVNKTGEEWKVEKVLIHKVDGKKRFTYENNQMVPVKD